MAPTAGPIHIITTEKTNLCEYPPASGQAFQYFSLHILTRLVGYIGMIAFEDRLSKLKWHPFLS